MRSKTVPSPNTMEKCLHKKKNKSLTIDKSTAQHFRLLVFFAKKILTVKKMETENDMKW